jgi:murein DD-endopeptidase MepM/ murein hydrolase activator NlpD
MASGRDRCIVCRTIAHADDQFVLVAGRRRQIHCSEDCLGTTVRKQRAARRRLLWRGIAGSAVVMVVLGVFLGIKSHRKPVQRAIALPWTEPQHKQPPPPPGPNYYGPAWPPTDEDWQFAFERARWIYPLPGPVRREPTVHDRLLAPEPPKLAKGAKIHPPEPFCRKPGTCGVTLGGQLWGEHVYAVQAGVVDYARATGEDAGGGGYVRIAHFGGMVFSHYYHLAAIPKGIARGARVAPGDVVGLVGDTGTGVEGPAPRSHLHFAFSIHPSIEQPDVYWDPTPLMARWPLKVPPHGTVAGLTATVRDEEAMRKHRIR